MNKFALAISVPFILIWQEIAVVKLLNKYMGNHMTKISYSVSALSDNICKLKAEKSANFNNATICNFYTGPLSEGLTQRDHKWKMFHIESTD